MGRESLVVLCPTKYIDTDFEGLRRDEVKAYMEYRFGKHNVCSVGTYGNLKLKMLFTDLSRLNNIPITEVKVMTSILGDGEKDGTDWNEIFYLAAKSNKLKAFVNKNPDIINDSKLCLMQPRSSSIHACATIITPDDKDIFKWFPVKKEKNKNDEVVLVSEWEGIQLDQAGFLKEDILGIAQLDKIANIIKLIKINRNVDIDFRNIPLDDYKTYKYFGNGWNEDTFQFGTRGLKNYTKQLKPDNIDELSATNALYRPGAMKSNAHNDFVHIKFGKKEAEFDYMLDEVTKETYGLYLYQEQTMLAAQKLGNMTLVEADMMRKVMLGRGKKQHADQFYIYHDKFIKGAVDNGCDKEIAEKIWLKLEAFAGYGFNKCIHKDSKIDYYCNLSENKITRMTIERLYKRFKKGKDIYVNTYSEGKFVPSKVKNIFYTGKKQLFKLSVSDQKRLIVTSKDHKFLTHSGWKRLEDLKINDEVFMRLNESSWHKIKNIEQVEDDDTYDIEVENGEHNYVANAFVVHNSHAVAYAITGYISQWFKVNYPIEFWSTAFKFAKETKIPDFISEINLTGDIKILPVDINKSKDEVYTDFKSRTIFWPLISIKQCGDKAAEQIFESRDKHGQFFSFEEFLERNKFKGSKVTKQVIENLVLSGAFDELEFIEYIEDRLRLIENYRKINKIKVDKDKDLIETNRDNLRNRWWWSLQQKRLSGISFFDYKDLCNTYLSTDDLFVHAEDFQLEQYSKTRERVKIGGYINEIIVKESKKGKWCKLIIESNYNFVKIIIWPEQYKEIEKFNLIEKEKCLLLITGQVSWDSFNLENVLQTNDDTEFIFLE